MNKTLDLNLNRYFAFTGIAAIIIGASIAAFSAKTPSTLAMWASAYLVLVVGLAQLFLGQTISQLVQKSHQKFIIWIFGLFNTGNAIVICSSVLKYSGHEQHVAITTVGSVLISSAMILIGLSIWSAKKSGLKITSYTVITLLAISSFIGVILAGIH